MFPISFKLFDKRPPGVTVREWKAIRKSTYRAIGRYWYAHMLPDHFKPGAQNVYKYRRRTKKYLDAIKNGAAMRGYAGRVKLHPSAATMPLTKTGLLQQAMTSRGKVIKAYPSRFTVRMPGLPYTPARQRSTVQPFLKAELTKLLKREIKVLQKIGKAEAVRQLNAVNAPQSTTLK